MADVVMAVPGRRETAQGVLDAAQTLAGLLRPAGIVVLAVDASPPANPLAAQAATVEMAEMEAARKRDRGRLASLRTTFNAWAIGARQAGISAHWTEVRGATGAVVEERGRRADFVVIARPEPDDDPRFRQGFHAALFQVERPVLVVPDTEPTPFGRNVAIAWRDDSRAANAVIPALRVLGRASQVHLLAGVRAGAGPPAAPAVLRDRRPRPAMHMLPIGKQPFGKTLLEKLHELDADMLVMGADGNGSAPETIFGSVTQYVLEHADVPLLMRH